MPKTSTTVDTNSKTPQIPPAISFKLSDKSFLDLGWTIQPNIPLAFPVVTMKAKFAHRVISPWFQERQEIVKGKYPNGKTAYLARPDGSGKIFYPNGKLAINIQKGGVLNHRTRIWVKSPGEVDKEGVRRPAQLIALFDSLGNGVVYDFCLKKRLVYNQKEGVLWDVPHEAPVHWKWHNLPYTGSLTVMNEDDNASSIIESKVKEIMFVKPQRAENAASGLSQDVRGNTPSMSDYHAKLTPSEIRFREKYEHKRYLDTDKIMPRRVSPIKPIILQINRYLALRILSQSNISLSFFAKTQQTQLKIGILYNPSDKLKVTEVDDPSIAYERVVCPFESFPAKTRSMQKLHRQMDKLRKERCVRAPGLAA